MLKKRCLRIGLALSTTHFKISTPFPSMAAVKRGKRAVYVTPYYVSAKEVAEKYKHKGFMAEIKREYNDYASQIMFVVYVFNG